MGSHPFDSLLLKLTSQTRLSCEEQDAVRSLRGEGVRVRHGAEFVERDREMRTICAVVDGLVARTVITADGGRQITSFYVAGDIPDLHTAMQPKPSSSLRALTDSQIYRVSHAELEALVTRYPGLMEAFWRSCVFDAAIATEWVVNLGKRSAQKRIAHLFCEMAVKNRADGGENVSYAFPVTQAVLADATGLSAVHVNRSLQSLRRLGLLQFDHATVTIPRWEELCDWADFHDGYLRPDKPRRCAPETGRMDA